MIKIIVDIDALLTIVSFPLKPWLVKQSFWEIKIQICLREKNL